MPPLLQFKIGKFVRANPTYSDLFRPIEDPLPPGGGYYMA